MTKSNVLLERFLAVAQQERSRVACICGEERLTYQQLGEKVRHAAAALHSLGVVKGDLVFVALDNSLEVPIVYLAAMWLGAVFVPMNPAWPQGRREDVIWRINPKVVVAVDRHEVGVLPPGRVLDVASLVQAGQTRPSPAMAAVGGRDLIYGFFTSGSTGIPKCALNCYEGLENRFDFMTKLFGALPSELVVLQNSRVSFDSSIWQLVWPLTVGGSVVIRRSRDLMDFEEILDDIAAHRIVMTDFVPSVLSEFVRYISDQPSRADRLQSMRHVLVGGEAIVPRDITTLKSLIPGLEVFNTYGPTEASIGMMFHQVSDQDKDYIPIGRPIPNTHACIVDAQGKVLPDGELGEIIIGGHCIGHGYLMDEEMTRRCFIQDPTSTKSGARAFRTGNIGFRDETGVFHYRGRDGEQIKVNGVRLELGEVESIAMMLPGVRKAKAAVYEYAGRALLICFLEGDDVDLDRARQHFRSQLPKEAWPRRLEAVARFPINDNGKTDVEALMRQHRLQDQRKAISDLVTEVLGVSPDSPDQDLTELGANSLDAYMLCSALDKQLHVKVWPPALMKSFSLANLWAISEGTEMPAASRGHRMDIGAIVASDCKTGTWRFGPAASGVRRTALVTGVTGYVGVHLLAALMSLPRYSKIVCLVRRDAAGALSLLKERFKAYQLDAVHANWDKVELVPANLRREDMGLPAETLQALGAQCADIYALAAQVSMAASYESLRAENVDTLKNTLSLAARCSAPVRYLSTSTLNKWCPEQERSELARRLGTQRAMCGYDLSKLVCEHHLASYQEAGGQVTCLRVGEILPELGGVPNANSLMTHLLALCQVVGFGPSIDLRFDGVGIDPVIDALLAGRNTIGALGMPMSLRDYFAHHHPHLPIVDAEAFLTKVRQVELENLTTRYVRDLLAGGEARQLSSTISAQILSPHHALQTKVKAPRLEPLIA